jgi:4-alpha-glucanotransferase
MHVKTRVRGSGILMHISSLPGKYGIGDFGEEAYKFVDFLEKSKQKYWQILPLGMTGYGDSPYQSFSSFAGNPYFIDLDEFKILGWIKDSDIEGVKLQHDIKKVSYSLLNENKMKLLRIVYNKAKKEIRNDLDEFYFSQKKWIKDFCIFMSIKSLHNGKAWMEWSEEYKIINSKLLKSFVEKNEDDIFFWVFTQFFFFKQWDKLKLYANNKGIKIIGDIPIYVSMDSCDLWSNPMFFKLDEKLLPISVAGCPPDYFSEEGQLWGNPLYNWEALENKGFEWWIERIEYASNIYDVLRIDHFRGFESYWEIPYGNKNAVKGKWVKGPGTKLFERIKDKLGNVDIIAEDLGFMTEEVKALIKKTGFPGMKILQFAFNHENESEYLPHNIERNSVVYTGTHDNETAIGWMENISEKDLIYLKEYLKFTEDEGFNWGLIRGAWSSPAYLAISPIQDFLGLDNKARMNTPSTKENNWTWRMNEESLTEKLSEKIANMTVLYWRNK